MSTGIIVLANSRKNGGRCVAGKDSNGRWIRLIKNSRDAIPNSEAENYGILKFLNVYGINNVPSREFGYHIENSNYKINEVLGDFNRNELDNFLDHPVDIFGDGKCLTEEEAQRLNYSLLFVKVTGLCLYIKDGGDYKDTLRAHFMYKGKTYTDISVTDAATEKRFGNFSYPYQEFYTEAYITISLGEIFIGNAYKLISGIILPNM